MHSDPIDPMDMHVFDALEEWLNSIKEKAEAAGVTFRFHKSPNNRLDSSCSLNVRRDDEEIDLVVWDSGAAEFTVGRHNEPYTQKHFDNIRTHDDLAEILSKLTEFCMRIKDK